MTNGGARGRVKLGELIDATLAQSDAVAHAGFVSDLAAVTRTPDAIAAVAERFLAEGERGCRTFLEWLARLRVRIPAEVIERVPPLLADPTLPDDQRIRVASGALRSSRNQADFLTRLVPALTAGLSPVERLARLRAVQGMLRRSAALDRLIARRERRLRLTCPRCPARLRRHELAKHLFEAHGLLLHEGRARRPDRVARELRKRYAAGRDTTILDQAAQLSDPAALRAWAARTGATPADLLYLLAGAAASGNGLCPRCLTEVAPSVTPVPPPLALGSGRVSGDGFSVEIRGPDALRTWIVATASGATQRGRDGSGGIDPRAAGILAAAAVLTIGIAIPELALASVFLAGVAYCACRLLRSPLHSTTGIAVERAWSELVPRLPQSIRDRFVTRLCRVSVGHGNAEFRAATLAGLTAPGEDVALRAAARFLQLDDASRLGIDRVAGVAESIAAGLRGEESLAFSEHLTELFLTSDRTPDAPERARLRVLVLDAAFAAGLTPRGLADLWVACPRLRELLAVAPLSRLGLQYVVWTLGEERPWEASCAAGSVFELARVAPRLGGRFLAAHPDLLLYHRTPPDLDEALGWALVCARGVVIGGKVVADPDAEVRVEGGRLVGAATLVFGPHRISLSRRPPAELVTTIRRLLRLRSELFVPKLDAALAKGPTPPILAPLARRCRCGADILVAAGEVGRMLRVGS